MLAHEKKQRIAIRSLNHVDGKSHFGGLPFDGVGLKTLDNNRMQMLRFDQGMVSGDYVERLLDLNQAIIIEERFLDYAADDSLQLNGEAFSGCTAEIHDSRLRMLNEIRNGLDTGRRLAWHADGTLEQYVDLLEQPEGFDRAPYEHYRWHANERLAASLFYPLPRCGSIVNFDAMGNLSALQCSDGYLDVVTSTEHRPKDWVWTSVEQLSSLSVGKHLALSRLDSVHADTIVDALIDESGLSQLESMSLSYKSVGPVSLQSLLVPSLKEVEFNWHDAEAYPILCKFKRNNPDARVVFDRIELRPATDIVHAEQELALQAHYFDPSYTRLVGWSELTQGLGEDEMAGFVGNPDLRYLNLKGRSETLQEQARSIKHQRPEVTVKVAGKEVEALA